MSSEGTADLGGYIRLLRGIIVQSISDLGSSRGPNKQKIIDFIDSDQFEELCDYSCWEAAWLRDVASGILALRPAVRREITKQSVDMLKLFASKG